MTTQQELTNTIDQRLYLERYTRLLDLFPHFYSKYASSNLSQLVSTLAKTLARFDQHAEKVLYGRWIEAAQPFNRLRVDQQFNPIDLLAALGDCQRLLGVDGAVGENDEQLRRRARHSINNLIKNHSTTSVRGTLHAVATALDLVIFDDWINKRYDSYVTLAWPGATRYSQARLYHNNPDIQTGLEPQTELTLIENPLKKQQRQFTLDGSIQDFSFGNSSIISDCPEITLEVESRLTNLIIANDQQEVINYKGDLKAGDVLRLRPAFDNAIHAEIITGKENNQFIDPHPWLNQYANGQLAIEISAQDSGAIDYSNSSVFATEGNTDGIRFAAHANPSDASNAGISRLAYFGIDYQDTAVYLRGGVFGAREADTHGIRFAAHPDSSNVLNSKIPNLAYFGIGYENKIITPIIQPGQNNWHCYHGYGGNQQSVRGKLGLSWFARTPATIDVLVQETNYIKERQNQMPDAKDLVRRYMDWAKAAGVIASLTFHNTMNETNKLNDAVLQANPICQYTEHLDLGDAGLSVTVSLNNQEQPQIVDLNLGYFDQTAVLDHFHYPII